MARKHENILSHFSNREMKKPQSAIITPLTASQKWKDPMLLNFGGDVEQFELCFEDNHFGKQFAFLQ